jgi:hypothetical protein
MRQACARTIGWPGLKTRALANSVILETTPLTRYPLHECGLVRAFGRFLAGRASPQDFCDRDLAQSQRPSTSLFDPRLIHAGGEIVDDPRLVRRSERLFEVPQAGRVLHAVGLATHCRMGIVFEQST